MSEDLGSHRRQFSTLLAHVLGWLTEWCEAHSMGFALDRLKCCANCAKPTSLHMLGCAVDIHLYKLNEDGSAEWLSDGAAHKEPGEYWESLGGSWGGRFDLDGDGRQGDDPNHYSLEYEGRR